MDENNVEEGINNGDLNENIGGIHGVENADHASVVYYIGFEDGKNVALEANDDAYNEGYRIGYAEGSGGGDVVPHMRHGPAADLGQIYVNGYFQSYQEGYDAGFNSATLEGFYLYEEGILAGRYAAQTAQEQAHYPEYIEDMEALIEAEEAEAEAALAQALEGAVAQPDTIGFENVLNAEVQANSDVYYEGYVTGYAELSGGGVDPHVRHGPAADSGLNADPIEAAYLYEEGFQQGIVGGWYAAQAAQEEAYYPEYIEDMEAMLEFEDEAAAAP